MVQAWDFADQGVVTTTAVRECALVALPEPVAALLDVVPGTRVRWNMITQPLHEA
ncbi:hypothetical protein ACH4E9_17750 [Streptomyces anulatus]